MYSLYRLHATQETHIFLYWRIVMSIPYEAQVKRPEVGQPAPKFRLPAYPSGTIGLDDYLGKKNVILAFYPMDDTPGCTKEMCAFSQDILHFQDSSTQVLG